MTAGMPSRMNLRHNSCLDSYQTRGDERATHSHCHPYNPLNPDMNDTPVAMRPPKAPATAILAEKMAIRV
jgi:hypothetical protein